MRLKSYLVCYGHGIELHKANKMDPDIQPNLVFFLSYPEIPEAQCNEAQDEKRLE
jgi:hypothetical protein